MAFKDGEEPKSPNMIQIGKEIAKECFGSPLVIRTIGRMLCSKPSKAGWLSFKKSDLGTITRQENGIAQVLKLSYNHLPLHLKPCFAYCALFPEDHWFNKDELIQLWVAEGFVLSRGENKCLEDVGDEYFMELTWRSIFQDVERNKHGNIVRCKMHDLMHDLARLVAGTECYTTNSDIENVNRRTRRISHNCYRKNWSLFSTPRLKPYKLRTFLSSNGYSWERDESKSIANISSLGSLRVLQLNEFSMKEVPFSIGMLKHLRYLDLRYNHKIHSLPSSITKFHNLQTLIISSCSSLKELPRDIGNLTNLRHLNIHKCCSIDRLPTSVTKLKCLQTFILSDTYLKELPRDIENLTNLRHLNIHNCYLIDRLPTSVTKLKFLQTLILSRTRQKELPENIGNMLDLRILDLEYSSIKSFPNSIVKLKKLQSLNLKSCRSLVELPSDVSNLVNLQHLDLAHCDRLRSMLVRLNKLTALQTLNLFAVGASVSSEDGGLWQLNTLINLRGNLCIRGLHHLRKDASQANTVNLKDVHGVRDLRLQWTEADYNPTGIDDPDFVVLEKLHPNKNVETLRIQGYGGVRLPGWVSSLSNMIHLSLQNCERLLIVPRLDRLPKLQKLKLCNINSIEYLDNSEAGDGSGSNVDLFKGEVFVSASPEDDMQQREVLDGRDDLRSSLQSLSIIDCNDLIAVPGWIGNLASLQKLKIRKCRNLTSFPDGIGNLTSLQELEIGRCDNLTSLPERMGNLASLQKLVIHSCLEITSLGDGLRKLTSLWELIIHDCPKLDWHPENKRQLSAIRRLTRSGCGRRQEERRTQQNGENWSEIAPGYFIRSSK